MNSSDTVPSRSERIFLVGYRGSGKSTVGKLLADKLGWSFADTDLVVEKEAGCSISELFARKGEAAFRDAESQALETVSQLSKTVVATGGGMILRPENRLRLRSAGTVVWLEVSPATAWERMNADPTTAERRPNLTGLGGFEEVRQLIRQRESLYQEVAHFRLPADRQSPEQLVSDILALWQSA